MENFFHNIWTMIVDSNVLHIVSAVLILVIGWLLAVWLSGAVRKGIDALGLESKLGKCLPAGAEIPASNVSTYVSRAVYFLILLFAVLGCLTALNLSQAAAPIQKFFDALSGYAANLIGALALAFIAWVVAMVVRIAAAAARHVRRALSIGAGAAARASAAPAQASGGASGPWSSRPSCPATPMTR